MAAPAARKFGRSSDIDHLRHLFAKSFILLGKSAPYSFQEIISACETQKDLLIKGNIIFL